MTWVELVVRQGLVFLLVAMSPMALAIRVWPAAAGVWRKMVELGVALIVSKFVVALALALGSDALAGSVAGSGGPSATAMATGAGLMLIAALSPFVLLRVMPGVEGALVAQGISRMPGRAAMTAVSAVSSAALLGRLAAGGVTNGGGASMAASAATGGSSHSAAAPTGRDLPVPAVTGSLAKAAALDARSRPALQSPGGDRGLPPGPKPLPPTDSAGEAS